MQDPLKFWDGAGAELEPNWIQICTKIHARSMQLGPVLLRRGVGALIKPLIASHLIVSHLIVICIEAPISDGWFGCGFASASNRMLLDM